MGLDTKLGNIARSLIGKRKSDQPITETAQVRKPEQPRFTYLQLPDTVRNRLPDLNAKASIVKSLFTDIGFTDDLFTDRLTGLPEEPSSELLPSDIRNWNARVRKIEGPDPATQIEFTHEFTFNTGIAGKCILTERVPDNANPGFDQSACIEEMTITLFPGYENAEIPHITIRQHKEYKSNEKSNLVATGKTDSTVIVEIEETDFKGTIKLQKKGDEPGRIEISDHQDVEKLRIIDQKRGSQNTQLISGLAANRQYIKEFAELNLDSPLSFAATLADTYIHRIPVISILHQDRYHDLAVQAGLVDEPEPNMNLVHSLTDHFENLRKIGAIRDLPTEVIETRMTANRKLAKAVSKLTSEKYLNLPDLLVKYLSEEELQLPKHQYFKPELNTIPPNEKAIYEIYDKFGIMPPWLSDLDTFYHTGKRGEKLMGEHRKYGFKGLLFNENSKKYKAFRNDSDSALLEWINRIAGEEQQSSTQQAATEHLREATARMIKTGRRFVSPSPVAMAEHYTRLKNAIVELKAKPDKTGEDINTIMHIWSLLRNTGDYVWHNAPISPHRLLPEGSNRVVTNPDYAHGIAKTIPFTGGTISIAVGIEDDMEHFSVHYEPSQENRNARPLLYYTSLQDGLPVMRTIMAEGIVRRLDIQQPNPLMIERFKPSDPRSNLNDTDFYNAQAVAMNYFRTVIGT